MLQALEHKTGQGGGYPVVNQITYPTFDGDLLRNSLQAFWSNTLAVESIQDRLTVAMPLMRADGMQIVLYIQRIPSERPQLIISDHGDILVHLENEGINTNAASVVELLHNRLAQYGIKQNGHTLYRTLDWNGDATEIQIFAEGLASVSHLIYRHETFSAVANPAYDTVRKILTDLRLSYNPRKSLQTKHGRSIEVDFYIPSSQAPKAMQTLSQRHRQLEIVEIWSYRWLELKAAHSGLQSVMIYDEDKFLMDDRTRNIAHTNCDFFCPSHRTDEIVEFLKKAG